ncbi:MAG: glycosyltransferase family 4 protein [Bacillota bacterium]
MKKILFVSSLQIFSPMSGGQLRSANLCRAFAKLGYDVEVYSLTGRKEDYLRGKSSFILNPQKNLQETVNMNPILGFLQLLSYRFNLPPLWATWLLKYYTPSDLKIKILKADMVILDFPFLYPLFKKVRGIKWLNTHNAEFELWADRKALSQKVRDIELASFEWADRVLFCTERDLEKFVKAMPGLASKSAIVANGVEMGQFQFNPDIRQECRQQLGVSAKQKVFLFTGSSYEPNQEAFQFLRNFAFQNQKDLVQNEIVIVVAGTVSQELVDEPHFKVLGRVPEMYPYFAAADFGLNPMTKGSGVNVKMIEFIAARLPIVSTEFGCRGLSLKNGESCYIFERQNLLKTLLEVLSHSEREQSDITSRAFVENESRVDMTKALNQIVNNPSSGMGS